MKEYSLNDSQLGVYLDMVEDLSTTKYNLPILLELPDGVDRSRVWQALVDTVAAHPIYAATFAADDKGPVMRLPDDAALKLAPCAKDDFFKPFDLENGPLVRAALVDDGLQVEFHHLVCDGTTVANVCAEMSARYDGRVPEPEELTAFDKSAEDAAVKTAPAYAEAKAWFENRFGSSDCECGFEPDAETDEAGTSCCERTLDGAGLSVAETKEWAKANGITANTAMMSAFGYTVAAFAGADEGVFTMGTHGRTDPRYAKTHGMLVRTLPIKVEKATAADESCLDFMKRVQADFRDERKYDFYSFLDLAKDYAVSDRFNYVYNERVFADFTLGGKPCPCVDLGTLMQPGDFALMVTGGSDGRYRLTATYRKAAYRPDTVESFLNVFVTVLKGLRAGGKLADLELCDEATRKLLDANNETEVAYDREKTVVDLFREQAAARPDHPCVVHLDTTLTYREVDERSDRIAAFLNAKGIGKGDFVSILIPRSVWMTTASLGVLKSGAAYEPLDPSYPSERLEFMIADAGVKLVIADETLLDRIPGYKGEVVTIKELEKCDGSGAAGVRALPGDAFIILYTSGSTGKPKGAVLEHGNLMAFCAYHRKLLGLDGASRYAAYASYGFDANMMDQYPTLTAGATLYVIDESIRLDLTKIDEYFRANGMTHAFMTTQVGRAFAQTATAPSLKWMGLGGEALVPLEPPKGFRLVNLYGPTESTVYVTAQAVDRLFRHMPIGKATDNVKAYVVDGRGRRVPPGVPGELWVSGPQVGRGYLNNPEKTAAAFVANPFGEGRVYKTGDIVKFLADGTIVFVGRRDGQVKVRGFRIELSEVEEVIRRFPGVKDATVAAFDDPAGGKFVAAYVVGDAKIDVAAMNAFIAAEKPPYMVPAVTMQIDEIPLNQNQKVNRRALPKPERKLDDATPPENDLQRKLFDLVALEVGHRAFGIDNAFSEIGLTSIGAVRLNVALGKAFGRAVKLADLKANDTVRKFEAFLAAGAGAAAARPLQADYPLTKTQMGIFIESQTNAGTTVYNIPQLLKLGADIDTDRLVAALKATVDAHPYLKTRLFQDAEGDVRAKRRDEAAARVEVVEGPLPNAQSLVKPYDLLNDDLYRIVVYRAPDAVYLFCDFHHIVCDGTSYAIFMRDLDRAYAGEALEKESYTGFEAALDEEAALKTDAVAKAKAHYDAIFAGCEPDVIPEDLAAEGGAGIGRAKRTCALPAASVASFCEKNGTTPNAFFNAAFGLTLSRYVNAAEAVYTTVYNGRADSRTASSMSMFVKTLPVLFRGKDDLAVADAVRDMGAQLVGAMENDLFSFADIAQAYGVKADLLFIYQGDGFSAERIGGAACENVLLELNQAKAKLEINAARAGDSYSLEAEFDTATYTEGFVDGFLECLETVLAEFLKKGTLGDVDLCSEAQRKLLDGFHGETVAYDCEKTVVDQFREQAKARPDHPCVLDLTTSLTYREVDEKTDRIAAFLNSKGIGKGDFVAVLIPRNVWMVTASMGVLKSGAAYQPLDPSYPPERLEFMIADSGAKLVIADETLLDRIPGYKGEVVTLKDLESLPDSTSSSSLHLSPRDAFIVLYTSGSTGKPKGAVLEHGNLMAFCSWYRRYSGIDASSCASAYASYGFDCCMMDMYPALTVGATVCVVEESIRLDLPTVDRWFAEKGVTHSFMTTQIARQFSQIATAKSLKFLLAAGEALVPVEPPKNFELVNGYGPTECTILATAQKVERLYRSVPIGRVFENLKAYVVDGRGRRLPPGVPGELWLAGPHVARGYLNNPEKTAAAFIRNPFSDDSACDRVYKTGDIVKFQPDGTIMFVGRRDGQVKVRGFRIELSEVEEVIRRFPGVKDATVAAFDDPAGGKFVAAYVVGDAKIDVAAMNDFIRAEKPSYMVPAVTMQIDRIPLNQNYKVNRRALPKPERKLDGVKPPETECQKRLFEVVAKTLGHRAFGIETPFPEVGLTSIGVVKLSVALGKEFGIPFKIREITANNTIQKLEGFVAAAALKALQALSAAKPAPAAVERPKDYPVSRTQMGVFVETQAHPETTIYNIPRLWKLGAGVDVDRLVAALKASVDAHPYLKAHLFQDADGNVRARRRDDAEAKIEVVEGPLPEPQSLVKPYDLLNDDLYRIAVYRTPGAVYLFLDFNHIASDGESDAIFFRDLNRAYAGETLEVEEYTGFEAAAEEAEALKTDGFEKAKAHYEKLFAGCEPECQPAFDTEIGEEGAGRVEGAFGLPFESVRGFCRGKGVSENALFNAVFAFVLAKYAGRKDAIYTTVYNGRNDSRTANSVSMFVKTLPVWCDLDDGRRVADVVKGMGEQLVASMANDLFSFADVAKTYGVRSDMMFVYQGEAGGFDRLGGEPCESVPLHLDRAKALIDFQVWAKDGRIEYFCEYDRVNYSEWLLKGFAECFENTLAEFLAKETLGDVAVCSAAQLARLDGFNETGVVYDGPKTVVGLFRRSVEQFPDNVAVVHLDKKFTYRQVDEMSDRIAAHLRAKGIGREDLVAVLIPRCEYMTIASLGVSKAGAAYQPLDPSYPPERLAYMVDDTKAKLLIADESLLDRLPDYKGEILLTKDIPALPDVSSRREEILSWSPNPEDAFIILYTSGSTGKPKGAILEHRCLVNFCNWYPRYFNMGPDAHVAAYASYGFDACMMDMYPTLAVGATIYIVDDSIRLDLDLINAYFTEVGITHSFMTTQVCRQFAQVTTAPSLRHLTASGEKLVPIAPPKGFKFYNGGGPTECTIYVAAFQVEKMYRRVPLGYPLANLKAYVVDEKGRRLPPGVPGELWVSSVQISRLYLNNPEKTAAAYGVNPFTQEEGYRRIYRTGDICRIQEDGLIDILGRRDGMVKVRGFRIELSEVEEIVRRFPGVKDATVQAYDSPAGGKYICAYVVGDAKIDVEAMNAFILAEKPPYLVPAVTMQIDEIPLNQNQKVDKRKLPKPQAQRAAYVEPATDAEKAFCEAMGKILGMERVSATDDFFEIGGSSIAAISLMAKANAAGYPVTYANVFALRTPRALAEFASGGAAASKTEEPNVIDFDFNDYDHAAIGRLLEENTLESFRAGGLREVGNALFTGATGFMGIHLLARFLEVEKGRAYCLVRKGKYPTAGRRLRNLFHYYFEERYDEALAARVEVFDGDVTDPSSFDPLLERRIDTVFNCAANVKHFSSGTDIEDVNIGGAKAVIAFCLKSGARLVHFSTSSVQGFVPEKDGRPSATLDERTAYMGQKLPTKYASSKMIAELEVFKAVLEKGLDAKVIRLGYLSPRERDGEFQINFRTNAFMGTLRAYATLGCYPYSRLAETVPTDPIDSGAAAYLLLAKTPEKCRLFHATNYDTVPMGSIIRMMNAAGVKVDFVEDEEYDARLDKALEDPANARIFQPLLAYRGSQGDDSLVLATFANGYTTQVLARLGHFWKAIGEDYIESFVKAIRDLEFFG